MKIEANDEVDVENKLPYRIIFHPIAGRRNIETFLAKLRNNS